MKNDYPPLGVTFPRLRSGQVGPTPWVDIGLMNKKKLIVVIIILILLIVIYFPGFSRLQQLKEENKALEKRISELKEKNEELEKERHKLQTDPTYLESVAREKLKKAKKGEIIYKVD